jgi:hypothetical protein
MYDEVRDVRVTSHIKKQSNAVPGVPRMCVSAREGLPPPRKYGDENDKGNVSEEGHGGHDATAGPPCARVKLELWVIEDHLLRLFSNASRA